MPSSISSPALLHRQHGNLGQPGTTNADRINCGEGGKDSVHFDRRLDLTVGCEIENKGI